RPVKGAAPHIRTMEILADGEVLLRMSRRPGDDATDEFLQQLKADPRQAIRSLAADEEDERKITEEVIALAKDEIRKRDGEPEERTFQTLRIDRLASDNPVFRAVIDAIMQTH